MKAFITGGAGFIGSHLTDRLLELGHTVTVFDNFSTGRRRFLAEADGKSGFRLVEGDLLDLADLQEAMAGSDQVFHLAANADVRFGTQHPRKDLDQNTIGVFHVLEAMRAQGIRRIAFSSTGSVYGEPEIFPTPEDAPFPIQTSLYGASKLAGEGLIAAYCSGFGFQAHIFRFVSILGERYSHGHVFDFYKQLREHPEQLNVLGDGHQRKSYLYVEDCVRAILLALDQAAAPVHLFNLGVDDTCEVMDSIRWICEEMKIHPRIVYSGGRRGWVGDSPLIHLDCSRIRALGWKPERSIEEGVRLTLNYLTANSWLLEDPA
ncbi:MAG: NAD-dependent epimerase/dehydratase family protein [Kiritimatiellia bacterium]|nr:NAD-dependent epimerase/dehydratase family protein [Kiritimatiellia bacterium]